MKLLRFVAQSCTSYNMNSYVANLTQEASNHNNGMSSIPGLQSQDE